jgi:cytochrome c oxidase subunit IV
LSWEAAPLLGIATSDDAGARRRMRRLHHPAIKLVLVPAALTFILFRLHQIITYGGPMGEAHLFGLRRWLNTLLGVALYSFCTLLVVAVALRLCIEIVALLTSRLPPPWAGRVRVALEAAGATLYYGGLLALVVLRLGL